jgi:hypothetical protein
LYLLAHVAVRGNDVSGDGHDERPGEIGGGIGENARGVGHGKPELGGGGDVDVVEPDGVVGDAEELRPGLEGLAIDPLGEKRDQDLGASDALEKLLAGNGLVVGFDRDLDVSRLLQDIEARIGIRRVAKIFTSNPSAPRPR